MGSAPSRFPRDRRLPGLAGMAAGLAALALFLAAREAPALVESVYGRALYPRVARALAGTSGLVGFSVAEWVFAALVLSLLLSFPLAFARARRRLWGVPRALAAGTTALLGRAGMWWAVFVLLWGLNYARPLPTRSFALAPRPEGERAQELIASISVRLDAERAAVEEDPNGITATPDLRELDAHLAKLQEEVLREAGFAPVGGGRAKSFAVSPLLLRWGVAGVYGPFTGEPNLVVPAVPALLPSTLAHERAHLSGFASEEAASFVALLTCWRSPRPEVRYAAWLDLWLEFRHRPGQRAPGVRRDLSAIAAFLTEHRGPEAPVVWRAYSSYLKAHGVPGGTASYGRVAELALRYLAAHGMPPTPAGGDAPS